MEARFQQFISDLEEPVRGVLLELLSLGYIRDGIEQFGHNEGFNNGLFFCFLDEKKVPDHLDYKAGSAFWSFGRERKRLSANAFIACSIARIPLCIGMDGPLRSPIGAMMETAWSKGVRKLGNVGGKTATAMLNLSEGLVRQWTGGAVSDTQLGEGVTFTINDMEVRCLNAVPQCFTSPSSG